MKKFFVPVFAGLIAAGISAEGQTVGEYRGNDPVGVVTYTLPMTAVNLEVTAVKESFHAGPYAKYASKYLGMEARQKDEVTWNVTSVAMTSCAEADRSRRFYLNPAGEALNMAYLQLTSFGLVSSVDGNLGHRSVWRFPSADGKNFESKGLLQNLTTRETTLYKSIKKESSFTRVAVKQDMLVEKTEEKRASELADIIFSLREKKMQIITGDTDATFSGEAMSAAVAEISRLENEYLTLFLGYSETSEQTAAFDVVPEAGRENQAYVAFRISDSEGLVPSDNLSGRPVLMEIKIPAVTAPQYDKKDTRPSKTPVLVYREPALCEVKVTDGKKVLIQDRIPVYQLGTETTMPVNLKVR